MADDKPKVETNGNGKISINPLDYTFREMAALERESGVKIVGELATGRPSAEACAWLAVHAQRTGGCADFSYEQALDLKLSVLVG